MPGPSHNPSAEFDLILVGGGLQNGLIALSALHAAPSCRIALIEADARLGGNHTWCVHARDVSELARAWFEPLIVQRWPGYDVQFPGFERTLDSPYAVLDSERFASVLSERFARAEQCTLRLGCSASRIEAQWVELTSGERLHGRVVVDARGPDPTAYAGLCGYQKFVGLELQFAQPHGLVRPLLMDARCAQLDGFRFFYLLPLAADRLLIEETRFSCTSALDDSAARAAIYRYAERFGAIERCLREERGVLPMPWSMAALPRPRRGAAAAALVAGYRGGFFHPATGYSLPAALRVAELLGEQLAQASFDGAWQRFLRQHRAQAGYALQLNRLLFSAFAETDMWGVLARFYHLPEALIERFYAMDSSLSDRARILIGRPPRGFSVLRALSPRKGAA